MSVPLKIQIDCANEGTRAKPDFCASADVDDRECSWVLGEVWAKTKRRAVAKMLRKLARKVEQGEFKI